MLLGPSLPLIVPLLSASILTERLLAVVAWDVGILKAVFKPGDVRIAVSFTGYCDSRSSYTSDQKHDLI